jgi:hypothetical protein
LAATIASRSEQCAASQVPSLPSFWLVTAKVAAEALVAPASASPR